MAVADILFALPRAMLTVARRVLTAVDAVPRIARALDDIQKSMAHVERLATFAAEELPELVYQLEAVQERLIDLEKAIRESPRPMGS